MRRMTAGMLRRKLEDDIQYYEDCFTSSISPAAVQEISIQLTKLNGRDLDELSRKRVTKLIRVCSQKMKKMN
ncbi:MAG: hypothetical protein ABII22_00905 [Candidatus Micrarchaeota archaeon]